MSTRYVWYVYNYFLQSTSEYVGILPMDTDSISVYTATAIQPNADGSINLINPSVTNISSGASTYIYANNYFYWLSRFNERQPPQGVYGTTNRISYTVSLDGIDMRKTLTKYNGYAKESQTSTVSNAASTAYPPRSYAPKLANIWP